MPQSQIYLCDVPLENDYKNTFTFANATTQFNYFQSKVGKSYTDYNYLRKDNTIVVHGQVDDLRQYNYLFYQNTNFSNKWFYCFITKHEYVSDDSTRLYIETDVMQTWYFEIQYNNTFVLREHVSDDSIGANTVPENVELGEYIINDSYEYDKMKSTNIVIASTANPKTLEEKRGGAVYGGLYSGIRYFTYPDNEISGYLQALANDNKIDAVSSLFLAPSRLTLAYDDGEIIETSAPLTDDINLSSLRSLNGYTPKNKKLLTYPYVYLLATNNVGASAIYHQELWIDREPEFRVNMALCTSCSINMYPTNYKNGTNLSEALTGGKYPQLSWSADLFTNWCTQNAVNIGFDIAGGSIGTITDLLSLDISGSMNNAQKVASAVQEMKMHYLEPPQAKGNVNSGDVINGINHNSFNIYKMSIKQEYAKIIDEYFNMYGYKVNRVKSPNIHSRLNWNYLQTIGCNFSGNIPQDDMIIIKGIFDNGITFWHNPNNIFNYSLNNDII